MLQQLAGYKKFKRRGEKNESYTYKIKGIFSHSNMLQQPNKRKLILAKRIEKRDVWSINILRIKFRNFFLATFLLNHMLQQLDGDN